MQIFSKTLPFQPEMKLNKDDNSGVSMRNALRCKPNPQLFVSNITLAFIISGGNVLKFNLNCRKI